MMPLIEHLTLKHNDHHGVGSIGNSLDSLVAGVDCFRC